MKNKITKPILFFVIAVTIVFLLPGIGMKKALALEEGSICDSETLFSIPTRVFMPFGGKICNVSLEFCLIPTGTPIPFPYPFLFIEVNPPVPARLYFLWGIPKTPLQPSKLYRHYSLIETSWALGTYIPKLDDAFRKICLNRALLPEADGVIRIMGTSFPTDLGDSGGLTAAEAGLPQPVFNARDFLEFCLPNSPIGECVLK